MAVDPNYCKHLTLSLLGIVHCNEFHLLRAKKFLYFYYFCRTSAAGSTFIIFDYDVESNPLLYPTTRSDALYNNNKSTPYLSSFEYYG